MKRKMTAAQKKAYQQKQDRMKDLCKQWADMSPAERDGLIAKIGAIVTVEGRELSPRNTMLCFYQREGVSLVGGFKQWLGKGRCVRKGEKGISILFPSKFTKQGEGGEDDKEFVKFYAGTVFDVSQTDEIVED